MGSLNYDPIWLFFRGSDNGGTLQKAMEPRQRRAAIGSVESGSYAVVMRLPSLTRQKVMKNLVVGLTAQAVAAPDQNEVDTVLLVDDADSDKIWTLLNNPEPHLRLSVERLLTHELFDTGGP